MTRRTKLFFFLLTAMVLAAFILTVSAQTPAQSQQQQQTPPDRKAYTDASAIKEPDKKMEALDKFIKDFPQSTSVPTAYKGIFDILLKNNPDQTAKILDMAGKAVEKTADPQAKANLYNTIAGNLLDANILVNEAENMANLGAKLIQEESAKVAANPAPPASANVQANQNARPAPNPMARLNQAKANLQVTLGRIYVKQGKLDAAEKNLKEALAANPQLTVASLGLAEVYEKRGDSQNALTAYINAAAQSKIPASSRQALNALYAKTHKGSMAGLEEMLDAKYLEANPAPLKVDAFKPTATRKDRTVLLEVFTGSGCPPCVAADLAADLAMERYSNKELVVVMYHQHIPQPDPMTTPQTSARFKYYAGTGVPTMVIDGVTDPGGGGARTATKSVYDRFTPKIEKKLETPADARLKVSASLKGGIVKTKVGVDQIMKDSPDLKLHVLLVEEKLRYTGENGVRFHPMVVRGMAGKDGTGISVNSKQRQNLSWDFDLNAISTGIKKHLDEYEAGGHRGNTFTFTEKKYEINPKDLLVVAFVQDEKTKAILQTQIFKVK
jgi:tetratricopeptide (TPR) repeat protein